MIKYRIKKTFTLLELIVVIVVLGILAMLAVPAFNTVKEKSADSVALKNAQAVQRDFDSQLAISVTDSTVTPTATASWVVNGTTYAYEAAQGKIPVIGTTVSKSSTELTPSFSGYIIPIPSGQTALGSQPFIAFSYGTLALCTSTVGGFRVQDYGPTGWQAFYDAYGIPNGNNSFDNWNSHGPVQFQLSGITSEPQLNGIWSGTYQYYMQGPYGDNCLMMSTSQFPSFPSGWGAITGDNMSVTFAYLN